MRSKLHAGCWRSAVWIVIGVAAAWMSWSGLAEAATGHGGEAAVNFPVPLEQYQDGQVDSLWDRLAGRVRRDPFNLVAAVLFGCAILHTFVAGKFTKLAHKAENEYHKKLEDGEVRKERGVEPVSFKATIFHFLGEVEAVFGIWLIPLFIGIIIMHGWDSMAHYVDGLSYAEPIFVVAIMAMAATRPVVKFAEHCASFAANAGGGTVTAWWFSILTLMPLLASFITEPGAMTIAAMLLANKFYALNPSNRFKYATLGALFVAVSIGGTLTHFAAPPVLMVAGKWGLTTPVMFQHFGLKAVLAVVITNSIVFFIFRKELKELDQKGKVRQDREESSAIEDEDNVKIPIWVTVAHLGFLAWTVVTLHHPALVVGGLLFFLAFTVATRQHQYLLSLRSPVLVGFFLAGLVTHGSLQQWWLAPVLSELGEVPLFIGATILTSFNDNAAITYLASLVPAFTPHAGLTPEATAAAHALQYAVLAGAVTGGGLTVIANAPNPAGQSILNRFFSGGISPLGLFLGALGPTVIAALSFMLIRSFH